MRADSKALCVTWGTVTWPCRPPRRTGCRSPHDADQLAEKVDITSPTCRSSRPARPRRSVSPRSRRSASRWTASRANCSSSARTIRWMTRFKRTQAKEHACDRHHLDPRRRWRGRAGGWRRRDRRAHGGGCMSRPAPGSAHRCSCRVTLRSGRSRTTPVAVGGIMVCYFVSPADFARRRSDRPDVRDIACACTVVAALIMSTACRRVRATGAVHRARAGRDPPAGLSPLAGLGDLRYLVRAGCPRCKESRPRVADVLAFSRPVLFPRHRTPCRSAARLADSAGPVCALPLIFSGYARPASQGPPLEQRPPYLLNDHDFAPPSFLPALHEASPFTSGPAAVLSADLGFSPVRLARAAAHEGR